jgi:hypothetical protein
MNHKRRLPAFKNRLGAIVGSPRSRDLGSRACCSDVSRQNKKAAKTWTDMLRCSKSLRRLGRPRYARALIRKIANQSGVECAECSHSRSRSIFFILGGTNSAGQTESVHKLQPISVIGNPRVLFEESSSEGRDCQDQPRTVTRIEMRLTAPGQGNP